MKVKEITKKLLADACDDLNTVMKLDPPIPTDPESKEIIKATLENDLREAAKELIANDLVSIPDDPDHLFLQPKTVEVLEALEVVMPVKEEVVKKEVVKEKVVKKESTKKPKKEKIIDKPKNTVEKRVEKVSKKINKTRTESFVDVVNELIEPTTVGKIAEAINNDYISATGKDNAKQSLHLVKIMMPCAIGFGKVKIANDQVIPLK